MKRFVLSALSGLMLSTVAVSAVNAQTTNNNFNNVFSQTTISNDFPQMAQRRGMEVTPFNLVFLAYQGFFESEGIPMADGLITRYESHQLTARDLVEAAIKMHRLSADRLNDTRYLNNVTTQLENLRDHDHS